MNWQQRWNLLPKYQKVVNMRRMNSIKMLNLMEYYGKPNFSEDVMDTYDDGGEINPEKLNTNNKRNRGEEYYKNSTADVYIQNMQIFKQTPRFKQNKIPAFGESFSKNPDKPLNEMPYFINPDHVPSHNTTQFIVTQTEEEFKRKREEEKERNKEEIREIQMLNRENKKKAKEFEKKIKNYDKFSPKMFV